jgi:hypothetical protein
VEKKTNILGKNNGKRESERGGAGWVGFVEGKEIKERNDEPREGCDT